MASCKRDDGTNSLPENINYRQEMRTFVRNISKYAKSVKPEFAIIPQNGAALVSASGDNDGNPAMDYINAIDGIGQEDLFYGYDDDDQATSITDNKWLRGFLDMAKNAGTVKIIVTDYCSTLSKVDDSYAKNNDYGYISFAADRRELDNIPNYPAPIYHENSNKIKTLSEARNFLYLIAPDNEFSTQQEFIDAVGKTNYDFIIMDFFYNGTAFSASQIESLKQKANGGKRLLICYMSIGEAENYRYYWKSDWRTGNPSFIEKEDPNWPGNYYVRYWDANWQKIIFGNDDSYLKKIIDAGFDGVYLDIIDAYEQFER